MKRQRIRHVLGSLLATIVLLSACASPGVSSQVQDHQEQWQNSNVQHYRYNLQVMCFCLMDLNQPVTIEVNNGNVVSIKNTQTGAVVDPEIFASYNTVEKLFTVIQEATNRGADEIIADYDPKLGYPVRVEIDEIKEGTDDELNYAVSGFEVLN